MLELETMADYPNHVGELLGPGQWLTVTQKMIDDFAEVTGDKNWYHVDLERARRELPGGKTIAHGLLTLSLIPKLSAQLLSVKRYGRALNYGFDRVRYPLPVPAGARIRLRMRVAGAERSKGGTLIRLGYEVEVEGGQKPAVITEMLILALDET